MRIIAPITQSTNIRHMLEHIVAKSEPHRLSLACGPPLWDADAQVGEDGQAEPGWDLPLCVALYRTILEKSKLAHGQSHCILDRRRNRSSEIKSAAVRVTPETAQKLRLRQLR
jgi:hypothetical protein